MAQEATKFSVLQKVVSLCRSDMITILSDDHRVAPERISHKLLKMY